MIKYSGICLGVVWVFFFLLINNDNLPLYMLKRSSVAERLGWDGEISKSFVLGQAMGCQVQGSPSFVGELGD